MKRLDAGAQIGLVALLADVWGHVGHGASWHHVTLSALWTFIAVTAGARWWLANRETFVRVEVEK